MWKKLNRREKTIVRTMIAIVLIGLGMEGWDYYIEERTRLENDIRSKNGQIATFAEKLEGEHADKYRSLISEIDVELEDVESKIMSMPQETDANLYMSQTISEVAEAAGLSINSISNRKSKAINEEEELVMLRTYFGFDGDLSSLLIFFNALESQGHLMNMETLTISARRQPKRRRRNKTTTVRKMNPLNGNATLRTVFKPDPDASLDRYEEIRKKAVEMAKRLKEDADAFEAEREESDLADAIKNVEGDENAGEGDIGLVPSTPRTIRREPKPGIAKPRPGGLKRVSSDEEEEEDEPLIDESDYEEGSDEVDEPERTVKQPERNVPTRRSGLKPTTDAEKPKFNNFDPNKLDKPKLDPRVTPPKLQPKPKPLSHTAVLDDDDGVKQ